MILKWYKLKNNLVNLNKKIIIIIDKENLQGIVDKIKNQLRNMIKKQG